jgi:hypothetical protein
MRRCKYTGQKVPDVNSLSDTKRRSSFGDGGHTRQRDYSVRDVVKHSNKCEGSGVDFSYASEPWRAIAETDTNKSVLSRRNPTA